MKRCTATLQTTRSWQARRWVSHDKASLTEEALLRQVEAGLGHDADGNPLRVNPESKTVSTAAGELPISPVLDPSWIKSRRRQRKQDPGKPTGRFRQKLSLNPYARALASPIRFCSYTGCALPRHFLQDFELVSHPTTGEPWFAPGPLAFDKVKPTYYPNDTPNEAEDGASASEARSDAEAEKSNEETEGQSTQGTTRARPRRAPVTSYTLSRKALLDPLGPSNKLVERMLGPRNGTAIPLSTKRQTVFRQDMGDVILQMMRQTVVDALIIRADRGHEPKDKFVEPVSSWAEIKDVRRRGCVLWLPDGEAGGDAAVGDAPSGYATLDVDSVQYDSKMAVHNLTWLLGSEEVARLRDSVPAIFGKHQILVLKYWGSHSMVNLHMLLWRMHGYLARLPEAADQRE